LSAPSAATANGDNRANTHSTEALMKEGRLTTL
jgi:hypothetical protein